MREVHPTALIEKGVELGEDVAIGAYAVIEKGVRIGRGTHVMHHAVVCANARLGEDNTVYPFAVVGARAQVKKRSGQSKDFARSEVRDPPSGENKDGGIEIGAHNVFREHVTAHAGTERTTRIGDHNLFMVGCHVAHDVLIGSHCVVANSVALAGHVEIADHVVFGGLAGVAQLVKIGEGAFVAAGAMVEHDVPPYVIVQGDRARVRALNVVGLRRMGVPAESIKELRRVFRAVWISKKPIESNDPYARRLLVGRTR